MMNLIFAVLCTVGSLVLTYVVVMANAMSSSPSTPFQGGYFILAAWALTLLFWIGWWNGW